MHTSANEIREYHAQLQGFLDAFEFGIRELVEGRDYLTVQAIAKIVGYIHDAMPSIPRDAEERLQEAILTATSQHRREFVGFGDRTRPTGHMIVQELCSDARTRLAGVLRSFQSNPGQRSAECAYEWAARLSQDFEDWEHWRDDCDRLKNVLTWELGMTLAGLPNDSPPALESSDAPERIAESPPVEEFVGPFDIEKWTKVFEQNNQRFDAKHPRRCFENMRVECQRTRRGVWKARRTDLERVGVRIPQDENELGNESRASR